MKAACAFALLVLADVSAIRPSSQTASLFARVRPACTLTRTCVLRTAAAALFVEPLVAPSAAQADSEALSLLKQARAQLDPCKAMIENKDWDGVRTAVKTAPLAKAKALVKTYADELGDDGVDLMGPREDFVQAVQFLDVTERVTRIVVPRNVSDLPTVSESHVQTFVYNNIFITEQNGNTKEFEPMEPRVAASSSRACPSHSARQEGRGCLSRFCDPSGLPG